MIYNTNKKREANASRFLLVPLTGLDLIKEWPGPFPGQPHAPGVLHLEWFESG